MDVTARLGGHVAAIDAFAARPENWVDSHGTRFARHLVSRWQPAGRDEAVEGVVHLAAFVAPPGTVESYRVMTEGAYDVLRLTDVLPDPSADGDELKMDDRGRAERRLDLKERAEGQEAARLTHLVQVIAPDRPRPEADGAGPATASGQGSDAAVWRLLAFVVRGAKQRRALLVESLPG